MCGDSPEQIHNINFDMVLAEDWRHPHDQISYWRHRAAKCAEVLVPGYVPASFIFGAYVVDENAKESLITRGICDNIVVNPHMFFL